MSTTTPTPKQYAFCGVPISQAAYEYYRDVASPLELERARAEYLDRRRYILRNHKEPFKELLS